MKIIRRNRNFVVGLSNIKLKDCGSIYLKKNNQVTFRYKKSEYDVCKKEWGYYATPSINGRLKKFGFKTFLTMNKFKMIYINLVHKNKEKQFKKYIKLEKSKIVKDLTNFK